MGFFKCNKKIIDTHEIKPIDTSPSLPKCQIDRFEYGECKENIWVYDNLMGKNIIDIYFKDEDLHIPLRDAMISCLKDKYGD